MLQVIIIIYTRFSRLHIWWYFIVKALHAVQSCGDINYMGKSITRCLYEITNVFEVGKFGHLKENLSAMLEGPSVWISHFMWYYTPLLYLCLCVCELYILMCVCESECMRACVCACVCVCVCACRVRAKERTTHTHVVGVWARVLLARVFTWMNRSAVEVTLGQH